MGAPDLKRLPHKDLRRPVAPERPSTRGAQPATTDLFMIRRFMAGPVDFRERSGVVGFSRAWRRRRASDSSRNMRSLYALQRRIGFSWLRFMHPLEQEYQTTQMPVVIARSTRLYVLAVLALAFALLLDHLSGREFLGRRGAVVMSATLAVLIFPFSISILPALRPHFRRFLVAVFWVFGVGVTVSTLLSRIDGGTLHETGVVLIILACYFMSSMRLWWVVIFGVALSLLYIAGGIQLGLPHNEIANATYFLLTANLLGVLGYYYVDYSARTSFLLRSELEELAYCDGLTGLLNRRAFYRHLRSVWRQAERAECGIGLAIIDMDNLKQVNDTRGHGEGDRCLRLIADVLAELAQRPLDGIARLGGDEFAAVWFDVDEDFFENFAGRLREQLHQASESLGIPDVSVSVGVSCTRPQPGSNPLDWLQEADNAMYRVKKGRAAGAG